MSPGARDLCQRLDQVRASLANQTEPQAMTQLVREATNADGGPVFTEAVLKLLVLELLQLGK